jgi:hypothetical protein
MRFSQAIEEIIDKHISIGVVLALATSPVILIDLLIIGIVEERKTVVWKREHPWC